MALILDLLILAIIGLSVFFAYKKGLIRTLFSLVGFIAAAALAINLCTPVANWLDKEFINPAVKNVVLTAVNGSDLADEYEEALETVDVVTIFQQMPDSLRSFLENLNVDVDGLVSSAEKSDVNSMDAKERLIESVSAPISSAISKTISIVGLLIIFFGVLLLATRLLDAIFRVLPFAKGVNSIGGLIFGLLRGILFVMIFGAVVYGLSSGNILVSAAQLEDTLLLKAINEINPLLNAFK